jgi:hypothetical protein
MMGAPSRTVRNSRLHFDLSQEACHIPFPAPATHLPGI